MHTYLAKVVRVVDGDTVDLDIDLGFGIVLKKQRARLLGINTPESRTRDKEEKIRGLAAKTRLIEILLANDNEVFFVSAKKGKYGRYLSILYVKEIPGSKLEMVEKMKEKGKQIVMNDDTIDVWDVNEQLVIEDHAVRYFGGKR